MLALFVAFPICAAAVAARLKGRCFGRFTTEGDPARKRPLAQLPPLDQGDSEGGYGRPVPKRQNTVAPRADQTTFLVVDDYGTGGIWMYIHARSADEITDRFPGLTVFTEWRSWMTPDRLVPVVWNLEAYDIDTPSGYLKILESKPHAFFGARGYALRFEVDGDVDWVDLVHSETGAAIPRYGRGDSEATAAERAMARWLEERGRQ